MFPGPAAGRRLAFGPHSTVGKRVQGGKASGRRWASERGAGEDMGCMGVIEEYAGVGGVKD